MKKAIILTLGIPIIGFATLYVVKLSGKYRNTDTVMNRAVLAGFNCNNIKVQGDDLQNIIVKWDCDFSDWRVIYRDGKIVSNIKAAYGPQRFEVLYKGNLICKVSQVKLAWWLTYDYYFTLSNNNGIVKCSVKIIGLDADYEAYDK